MTVPNGRAGLCGRPEQWPWSSAAAHLAGRDDGLVRVEPMLDLVSQYMPDWRSYLALETPEETAARLSRHESTGRPLGSEQFLVQLEGLLGTRLRRRKPGPRPKAKDGIK